MPKLTASLALLSILAACGKESRAEMKATVEDLKTKTTQGVDQAKDAISKAIAELEQSSDETLSKIDAQLAVYREKARGAGESAQAKMKEALADLEETRRALAEKKTAFDSATPEKLQERLAELKSSVASAQKAIEDAARYFQAPD